MKKYHSIGAAFAFGFFWSLSSYSGVVIPKGISRCFEGCFASYQDNLQCHANALHFLLRLRQEGIDLKTMAYWDIQPHEGGHFYMINANHHARGNRHVVPREKPYDWIPLENWFNHGIVVSKMGNERIVFDCDYEEEPTPAVLSEYVQNMFYEKENDQVLRVKIHYAYNLLSQLDECYAKKKGRPGAIIEDPKLAYELDTWLGCGAPDEIDFIKRHQ